MICVSEAKVLYDENSLKTQVRDETRMFVVSDLEQYSQHLRANLQYHFICIIFLQLQCLLLCYKPASDISDNMNCYNQNSPRKYYGVVDIALG